MQFMKWLVFIIPVVLFASVTTQNIHKYVSFKTLLIQNFNNRVFFFYQSILLVTLHWKKEKKTLEQIAALFSIYAIKKNTLKSNVCSQQFWLAVYEITSIYSTGNFALKKKIKKSRTICNFIQYLSYCKNY